MTTTTVLYPSPPHRGLNLPSLPATRRLSPPQSRVGEGRRLLLPNPHQDGWDALRVHLKSRGGRFSCLFFGNSKQEQARKALENALGGKKSEFEKWNKEIERKKELGGGGSGGRGGWFGSGGWSNWFDDEHFREDAWQAIVTLTGIILLYLLIAKGGVMFAMVANSLVSILRGVRGGLSSVSTLVTGNREPATEPATSEAQLSQISAKDSVVKKWGTD